MKRSTLTRLSYVAVMLCLVSFWSCESKAQSKQASEYEELLKRINLPDGFEISYYATNVVDARSLARTEDGKTVFV
ncbi:MAG: hypothetical protein HWE07_01655, partial [Cytophagia bacterium]|nr:hypothetical protein [Cytophagia bacterium]